jgi:hypothetical protein
MTLLRQIEVSMAQGKATPVAFKAAGELLGGPWMKHKPPRICLPPGVNFTTSLGAKSRIIVGPGGVG